MQRILLALLLSTSAAFAPAARPRVTTQLRAGGDGEITAVRACEILDSRGNPTVEVEVDTKQGTFRASVPSGASTGIYEACELRDNDKNRYLGKGCLQAVANVNDVLGPAVKGMDSSKQREIDQLMIDLDGTPNKQKLGANAILGVSLAVSKAGASAKGVPLYQHVADVAGNTRTPTCFPCQPLTFINGGHAGNKLAFQEYFIIPTGAPRFSEGLRIGTECYHTLAKIIKNKFGASATSLATSGFAPPCDAREGVELVMEAIKKAGYEGKCEIGMDRRWPSSRSKDVLSCRLLTPSTRSPPSHNDVGGFVFDFERISGRISHAGEDCYALGTFYLPSERDDPSLKMTAAQLWPISTPIYVRISHRRRLKMLLIKMTGRRGRTSMPKPSVRPLAMIHRDQCRED